MPLFKTFTILLVLVGSVIPEAKLVEKGGLTQFLGITYEDEYKSSLQGQLEASTGVIEVRNPIFCSCVLTANWLDSRIPLTHAKDFKPNITYLDVKVGDVILEKYLKTDHIAIISDIQKQGYIVKEGNYRHCEYTEGRVIPYNSERIRGFYRPK